MHIKLHPKPHLLTKKLVVFSERERERRERERERYLVKEGSSDVVKVSQ